MKIWNSRNGEAGTIRTPCRQCVPRARGARGFTVIELLVVVAVIALLLSILGPAVSTVKRQVRGVIAASDQRQLGATLATYGLDHNDYLPESVATIGAASYWNWQEPMMMIGYRARSPRLHRSMSAYLIDYLPDPRTLYCPNAPKKVSWLQDAWDAGDAWDHPETAPLQDPFSGSYCFYWSYTGWLDEKGELFRGPGRTSTGRSESKLLISDYFGYDHYRSRYAFSSCEKMEGGQIVDGTPLSSPFWTLATGTEDPVQPFPSRDSISLKLRATFLDGHVETYSPADTTPMRVIWQVRTSTPYPDGVGPGTFFLPRSALP